MTNETYLLVSDLAQATRRWRERAIRKNQDAGLLDLSFRPASHMSSLGWLLAHQGAVYDFSLNFLILSQEPLNSELFRNHVPGTTGDWDGTSMNDIISYYDTTENAFLEWVKSANESDLERIVDGDRIPEFFRGMTVRQIISNAFVHLNHHNGHLDSLRRDWLRTNS